MPLFPQQFIDDLKTHADIVSVIQDYVSLKKAGATYKGLCPFHGEKTPSFHVNRDKGFFHCFGCNVGGDVFKFLELHDTKPLKPHDTKVPNKFLKPHDTKIWKFPSNQFNPFRPCPNITSSMD